MGQRVRADLSRKNAVAKQLFLSYRKELSYSYGRKRKNNSGFVCSTSMDDQDELRKLKLTKKRSLRTSAMTLRDTGASQHVMAVDLRERQQPRLHRTIRRKTIVENREAVLVGKVLSVSITVGQIKTSINRLGTCSTIYDLITGRQSMQMMRA